MSRAYRYRGVDWADPVAVRAYNREAQRRWRAKNVPNKGDRDQRAIGQLVAATIIGRLP